MTRSGISIIQMLSTTSLLVVMAFMLPMTSAFVGIAPSRSFGNKKSAAGLYNTNVEQIEFKIYPDGRVEETVRGVKGNNCHKVTEKINESLGKTIHSDPTEELYENELVIDQTLTNTVGGGGGDSADSAASWEGQSSW
eukprot:scaffold10095_cov68-Cylindrotheca_fusiformis.AAC.2